MWGDRICQFWMWTHRQTPVKTSWVVIIISKLCSFQIVLLGTDRRTFKKMAGYFHAQSMLKCSEDGDVMILHLEGNAVSHVWDLNYIFEFHLSWIYEMEKKGRGSQESAVCCCSPHAVVDYINISKILNIYGKIRPGMLYSLDNFFGSSIVSPTILL